MIQNPVLRNPFLIIRSHSYFENGKRERKIERWCQERIFGNRGYHRKRSSKLKRYQMTALKAPIRR